MMIQYVVFTRSALCHSQNQDALLMADKVYQKAGGQHDTLASPYRLAISNSAGGYPVPAGSAAYCFNLSGIWSSGELFLQGIEEAGTKINAIQTGWISKPSSAMRWITMPC